MKAIESKRHITNFYVSVAFGFLFFTVLGVFLISLFFNEEERIKEDSNIYMLFSVGVFFIFVAFYTIYQYLKNVPKIIIERNNIFFNKEMFRLDDIQFVNLNYKVPFRYVFKMPMEGFYIEFKNGKEKFVYDEMYSNIWEIKDYLKQVVIDKKEYHKLIQKQEVKSNQIRNEHFAYYKGVQLLSFTGLFFWLYFLMFWSIMFKAKSSLIGLKIFLVFFTIFIFYFGSRLMYHYGISRNYLIIKNFNLPFIKKVYRLEEIEEIVFESQFRRPNGLRVITKNYESKLYFGATLYDNTWRELKKELRKKGIKVRDECIDFEY